MQKRCNSRYNTFALSILTTVRQILILVVSFKTPMCSFSRICIDTRYIKICKKVIFANNGSYKPVALTPRNTHVRKFQGDFRSHGPHGQICIYAKFAYMQVEICTWSQPGANFKKLHMVQILHACAILFTRTDLHT